MATSNRSASKAMAYEYLDRALESERGIRVHFDNAAMAYTAMLRIYGAINEPKKASMEVYEYGHPSWGRSPFEMIYLRLDPPYNKEFKERPTILFLEKVDEKFISDLDIRIEDI